MEAINFISNWITWFLLIVPVSATLIICYFGMCKAFTDDIGLISDYNRKIILTIKASIIIMTISSFVTVVKRFYT